MPKTILLLRHGEEPEVQPDLDLSGAGRKRSERLAKFIRTEFGKPGAIFAAAPSPSSARCFLTMRPLAASLRVAIDGSFRSNDFAPLAFKLLGDPILRTELVVVCWTHHELPSLAAYLNVNHKDFPTRWADEVFDRLYVLTYKGSARPRVRAVIQPF